MHPSDHDRQEIEDDIPPGKQLFSVGWLSQRFQRSPSDVRGAMKRSGVRFVEARNEVSYVDGYGVVELARHFRREG